MNVSSQRTNILESRTESARHPSLVPTNDLDAENDVRWQLYTLIGTAGAYFCFFVILTMSFSAGENGMLAGCIIPLLLYDVVKILFSSIRLCKDWDIEGRDELKDVIECVLMLFYKVGRGEFDHYRRE